MRSVFALLILACTAVTARAADIQLDFSGGEVSAYAAWEKGPLAGEESVLRIELANQRDRSPVSLNPTVELWMPDMGHGSSPTKIVQEKEGSYRVSNIYFLMGGAWEVRVTLHYADGSRETKFFAVNIEG